MEYGLFKKVPVRIRKLRIAQANRRISHSMTKRQIVIEWLIADNHKSIFKKRDVSGQGILVVMVQDSWLLILEAVNRESFNWSVQRAVFPK